MEADKADPADGGHADAGRAVRHRRLPLPEAVEPEEWRERGGAVPAAAALGAVEAADEAGRDCEDEDEDEEDEDEDEEDDENEENGRG